jgi:hypothetical protein
MTSVDHDVIEAFRRAEQEMQDEWEARQAAAAKAQKSLRPQVFPEPAPTPRIFPAAPSTGGNCLAANGCCRLRITPAVGDRNPPSRYRREAGCSGPFRGLFRFVTSMIAVPGSGLVVSVLGLEYRFGEARGKRASGRAPTCGWWNWAVQPHAGIGARIAQDVACQRGRGGRNMSAGSPAIVARSPHARSSVSNGKRALPDTDGRGTWARRRRDLIASFTAELNRPLLERDRALIANAASLIVRCEQLHVRIVNDEEVDDDQLIRLSNVATRLLTALGLDKAKPQPSGPSLADIMREHQT